MSLVADESANCAKVKRIGVDHLGDVRVKIADLKRLETALVELLSLCDAGKTDCPMLRELFAD